MRDKIREGEEAERKLHDRDWEEYYQSAIEGLMAQMLEADQTDHETVIEIKRKLDFLQGYKSWLVGRMRVGKFTKAEQPKRAKA